MDCRSMQQEAAAVVPIPFRTTRKHSGANEYIQSHYNQSKYFPADQSNENIYNGRSLPQE